MVGIKIVKASLDVVKVGDVSDVLVLRGVIDPESLHLLLTADYQREILSSSSVEEMEAALASAEVPDIDLGMRGERTRNTHTTDEGDVFFLYDPVYIIDGLQRVTAAKNLFGKKNGRLPRLGVLVHFNTTEEWERKRFRILNSERVRLNSNILLRNFRYELSGIDTIYSLTNNARDFILFKRVSWTQRMKRGEVITAVSFLKTVAALHAHIGPGRASKVTDLARGWEKIYSRVGQRTCRNNIKLFFNVIDGCWGLRNIAYKETNPQVKITFQTALANLFSNHLDFWDESNMNRFIVPSHIKNKLALFHLLDPHVANLASSPGPARDILYNMLVEHINRGKRTRHLTPRSQAQYDSDIEVEENGSESEEEESCE